MCDHIICGNNFLAEQFSKWNKSVSVLPSPVDTDRFAPAKCTRQGKRVIGWLGQSSGFRFLYSIEPALREVLRRHSDVVLRIISDAQPGLQLPSSQLECIRYDRDKEVAELQKMSIGIMPLDDSVIARGKCSFKMLLYMSCGVPVVVSPIGMNAEVLHTGTVGLGAVGQGEWVECLSFLLENPEAGVRMGQCGRDAVLSHYSVKALTPRLAELLSSVIRPIRTKGSPCDQHVYS